MSISAKTCPALQSSPCLARQPILSKDEKVFGYELLFRENPEDRYFNSDVESATCNTIDTLNVMGLDVICDGRLAFINCTRQMLLKDHLFLLPPDKVVVEVQENVPVDEGVIGACQRLKQRGYRIALDNFGVNDPREPLVSLADIIKVDIRRLSEEIGRA